MADKPTTATMRPTISAVWAYTMISAALARAAEMPVRHPTRAGGREERSTAVGAALAATSPTTRS